VMDPSNPQVLFAALWAARVAQWEIRQRRIFCDSGRRVFTNPRDGGRHVAANHQRPSRRDDMLGRIGIRHCAQQSEAQYLTPSEKEPGITLDMAASGSTSTTITASAAGDRERWALAVSPDNADYYVAKTRQTWEIHRRGANVYRSRAPPAVTTTSAIDQIRVTRRTSPISSDQGAVISVNGGQGREQLVQHNQRAQFITSPTDNGCPIGFTGLARECSAAVDEPQRRRRMTLREWSLPGSKSMATRG